MERAFYDLRVQDLKELEGNPSAMCFLWNGQMAPLTLPFADYEEVLHTDLLSPVAV